MKTGSWRRPLAVVAVTSVVLGAGLVPAGATTRARSAQQARRQSAHGAPAAPLATIQQWVNRLLAAVGLEPPPGTGSVVTPPPPDTAQGDNGAGIDPNG
jgi:hypothetical protein